MRKTLDVSKELHLIWCFLAWLTNLLRPSLGCSKKTTKYNVSFLFVYKKMRTSRSMSRHISSVHTHLKGTNKRITIHLPAKRASFIVQFSQYYRTLFNCNKLHKMYTCGQHQTDTIHFRVLDPLESLHVHHFSSYAPNNNSDVFTFPPCSYNKQ